jgi:adenylate cyclase
LSGRTEDAIAAFKAYDARSPGFGLADLVIAYHQSGRLEEARRAAERLLAARRDFTVSSWANTQLHRDARQLAGELEALHAAGLPAD